MPQSKLGLQKTHSVDYWIFGMPDRPSIPSEIEREILTEAGHRCAVCGVGVPLERAHIIPWCETREHKAEDLICLCANCHERADREKWGEKTLREYKRIPWILRQNEKSKSNSVQPTKVVITIETEIEQFDEKEQLLHQYALAGFLQTSPHNVHIVTANT